MLKMAGQVAGDMQRDHPLVVEMVDLKPDLVVGSYAEFRRHLGM